MKAPQKAKRVFISPQRENVNKSIFRHPVFNDVAEFLPWAEGEHWPAVESLNMAPEKLMHVYTRMPLVFEKQTAEFNAEGVDDIYCISVNDAFVMNAWGKSQNLENVKLIPDGSGEFTRKMGMLVAKDNLGHGLLCESLSSASKLPEFSNRRCAD